MLSEAFDGAALTRRVTAFEEHNNPLLTTPCPAQGRSQLLAKGVLAFAHPLPRREGCSRLARLGLRDQLPGLVPINEPTKGLQRAASGGRPPASDGPHPGSPVAVAPVGHSGQEPMLNPLQQLLLTMFAELDLHLSLSRGRGLLIHTVRTAPRTGANPPCKGGQQRGSDMGAAGASLPALWEDNAGRPAGVRLKCRQRWSWLRVRCLRCWTGRMLGPRGCAAPPPCT
jgi:hypothetical protein